eukprot:g572.t1
MLRALTVGARMGARAGGARRTFATQRLSAVEVKRQLETVRAAITSKSNLHRSNAEGLISEVPVIEVAARTAVCDGGGGALGHPVEFIQLDRVQEGTPETCPYCGLRFKMADGFHH